MVIFHRHFNCSSLSTTLLYGFISQSYIFNHLTERLSLLIILLFGEGLVLLIQNIELAHLNSLYTLCFAFISLLFIIYVYHYKATDKNTTNKTGFTTIYIHLLLLFSLDMMFLMINKLLSHGQLKIFEIYGFILFLLLFIISTLTNIRFHRAHV